MTTPELSSSYAPETFEKKWYAFWIKEGLFTAEKNSAKKPYIILMPPPNVTSQLHMGHGTGYTTQDLLIRYHRMRGFNALWLPGTDHAGIATQMMVEKDLFEKEGKTRQDVGRPAFEKRLHAWKDKYGSMITDQFRAIGFSCDWSREAYTMDEKLSRAVREVFVRLYEDGMIYRGERLVNWDPALKTAVSDDEVESKEITGNLYTFKYPVKGGGEIQIATTRPETMLGDTAVAVHPEDERYKDFIGKKVLLPITNREIPIVADDYVKPEFGTGAVKITPAHDPNDFELGKRHKLPSINMMTEDGKILEGFPFAGLDRFVARKEIIKKMKELNLFEGEKSFKHAVPHSERSKAIIEPRLSLQWYVRMQSLAEKAAGVARSGELTFYPDSWKKTYLHWLDNIQDWCISRQLWWGHRIPIWYCNSCKGETTGRTDPTACKKCGSTDIHQDEDVLDTWFSSWLWPVSPFGWPEETDELKNFYPSNVLITASEIIFLWVARMVMAGFYTQGKSPFKDVYITATVCDKQGKKFSKTLGNGIDPLELIEKHGADATRFTSVSLAPLGGRVRMEATDFEHGSRFVNKLWNAARFVLRYAEGAQVKPLQNLQLSPAQKWILHEMNEVAKALPDYFEKYRVNEALDKIYHFVWGSYCDWALEEAKIDLAQPKDSAAFQNSFSVLVYVLDGILRFLSPITPFVTEEIWHKIPRSPDWDHPKSLVIANYPEAKKFLEFPAEASTWSLVQKIISEVRTLRAAAQLAPKDEIDVLIYLKDQKFKKSILDTEAFIRKSCSATKVTLIERSNEAPKPSLVGIGTVFEVFVPAQNFIDREKELKRLTTEIARLEKLLGGIAGKLNNQDFVARAPEDILAQTRAQKENFETQIVSLKRSVEQL